MKTSILVILIFWSISLFAQHTIFTDNHKSIQCKIEHVSKDTIFFRPDYDTLEIKFIKMKHVVHYTYNIVSPEEMAMDSAEKANGINFTTIESIKQVPVYNNLELISLSGREIKNSVVLGLIGVGLVAATPLVINFSDAKPDYTYAYLLGVAGLFFDVAAIVNIYSAGSNLERVSIKNKEKLSLKIGLTNFKICARF